MSVVLSFLFCYSKTMSRLAPIQWIPGPFTTGVKRPERVVVHSPSSNILNYLSFISTPLLAFMVWCLGPGEYLSQRDS